MTPTASGSSAEPGGRDPLADLGVLEVPSDRGQAGGVDLEHGQVESRVDADEFGLEFAAVAQSADDLPGQFARLGQHPAVRPDHGAEDLVLAVAFDLDDALGGLGDHFAEGGLHRRRCRGRARRRPTARPS